MISPTEQFALGGKPILNRKTLRPRRPAFHEYDRATQVFFCESAHRFLAPLPDQEPFDWCVENVVFADTEVHGPFDPVGREFLREPINDINDTECRDHTMICATGVGKTASVICRIVWSFENNPRRGLMVMPATKGAGGSENFVSSRLIPCLEATAAMRALMPDGQQRLFMNSKKVRLNGGHYDFVGGGSASAVASNRCSHIEIDESDKLKDKLGNEAGTKKLVAERTEGVKDYTSFEGTTPTIESAQGWKALLRSDFRRRFLPCPLCNGEYRQRGSLENNSISESNLKGWLTLAWSEQYCVLPSKFSTREANGLVVPVGYMKWDDEAKRRDGEWDRDRVVRSARLECPHCQGHIRDEHKIWMDKKGVWIPLQENHGHKGYHLSALYAPPLVTREEDPTHKSRLAGRALKFLDANEDGEGMKGFINSTLAEVDVSQEHGKSTIELNSSPLAQPDWIPVLTADFHKNHPYIWFVIRKWCAFKLGDPVSLTNGLPDFVADLEQPGNEEVKKTCDQLVEKAPAAWYAIGELARFNTIDGNTGRSPLIDFLLAQKITGTKLVSFFKEPVEAGGAGGDTVQFRKNILLAMFKLAGGDEKKFRASRGGDSELIAAGYCDRFGEYAWDELREIIAEFKIGQGLRLPGRAVAIDCGYKERFDRAVLRQCYESTTQYDYYNPLVKTRQPVFTDLKTEFSQAHGWDGWQAIRGVPSFQPQGERDLGLVVDDPFYGTPDGGTIVVDVLNIPTAMFWLRKDDLRQRRTKQLYTISPAVSFFPKRYLPDGARTEESIYLMADYEKQSNMMLFDEKKKVIRPRYGVGGSQSKRHPDHPDDCETYQVAMATHLEFFDEGGSNAGRAGGKS